MATIVFYEKPGCASNASQKAMLEAAGHTVLARSVLAERWEARHLRAFFGSLPVAEWFNAAAPRIKSGEVRPDALDEAAALDLMLADPLLIRRPLIDVDGECRAGFDPAVLDRWIGLGSSPPREDLQACGGRRPCPAPER
jgi:nitrogenase-associated protein